MKIDTPTIGTRWFRFSEPQNVATIVSVMDVLGNGWIRTTPPIIENNQTRNYWTHSEFCKEFRPL